MEKEFKYKGVCFTIKVDLNSSIERRIGGTALHRVMIMSSGTSDGVIPYSKFVEVSSDSLYKAILDLQSDAYKWVDGGGTSSEYKMLIEMGFK